MFRNIYPLFNSKHVLKKEMLELLRDFPRDLFGIFYQDYSDGILTGCRVRAQNLKLTIGPGILYHRQIPYLLTENYTLPCTATGRLTYLKVRFPDKAVSTGKEEYLARILLDEKAPEDGYELELARFKLQEGARLRTEYVDFHDFCTEFDTVDRIHTPYASPGKNSIAPQITDMFREEMRKLPVQNPWDCAFCLISPPVQTAIPYETICTYLNGRDGFEQKEYTNETIYQRLRQILQEVGGKGPSGGQKEKQGRERGLMLF